MKFEQPECQHCKSRKSSLFHFCHLEEIDDIDTNKSCSLYKRGQIIFQEGTNPVGLYCLNSGKVKIYKHASDGKEQIVRIAKPGDFLGYCSLLANAPYPVSASALEDTTVCMIPKQNISDITKDNNRFSEGLIKLLCSTIDSSFTKMADLAYKPVRGRMAEALLFLHNFYTDEENPEGKVVITRDDLASFVGTVKETAIRVLKEFKKEQLIETRKSEIEIKDVDGLIHISEMYD